MIELLDMHPIDGAFGRVYSFTFRLNDRATFIVYSPSYRRAFRRARRMAKRTL